MGLRFGKAWCRDPPVKRGSLLSYTPVIGLASPLKRVPLTSMCARAAFAFFIPARRVIRIAQLLIDRRTALERFGQHDVGGCKQRRAHRRVADLADVAAVVGLAGLMPPWRQPEMGAHLLGGGETIRVVDGRRICERYDRPAAGLFRRYRGRLLHRRFQQES